MFMAVSRENTGPVGRRNVCYPEVSRNVCRTQWTLQQGCPLQTPSLAHWVTRPCVRIRSLNHRLMIRHQFVSHYCCRLLPSAMWRLNGQIATQMCSVTLWCWRGGKKNKLWLVEVRKGGFQLHLKEFAVVCVPWNIKRGFFGDYFEVWSTPENMINAFETMHILCWRKKTH